MGAQESFYPLFFLKNSPVFILLDCSFSSREPLTGHLLTTSGSKQLLFGESDGTLIY